MFRAAFALWMAVSAAAIPAPAGEFAALRAVDLRLAAIGYRLGTANAALCTERAPATGMVLHALSQYSPATRAAARAEFGFAAPLAVEGVVPGGPAARAGVQADDAVVAIAGEPLPVATPTGAATSRDRDAAQAAIAHRPVAPLSVTILRDGERRTVMVAPRPACAVNFEVLLDRPLTAQSDGKVVQLGPGWFERFGDEAAIALAAHELAHAVLRHRVRLEAAGVKQGLLGEFGRNQRLTRRIEDEADQLSAALLYNAGYDPMIAVRFWQGPGASLDGGIFRSRTHAGARSRAAAIAEEIARIPPGAPRPYVPPVLETRNTPLK